MVQFVKHVEPLPEWRKQMGERMYVCMYVCMYVLFNAQEEFDDVCVYMYVCASR